MLRAQQQTTHRRAMEQARTQAMAVSASAGLFGPPGGASIHPSVDARSLWVHAQNLEGIISKIETSAFQIAAALQDARALPMIAVHMRQLLDVLYSLVRSCRDFDEYDADVVKLVADVYVDVICRLRPRSLQMANRLLYSQAGRVLAEHLLNVRSNPLSETDRQAGLQILTRDFEAFGILPRSVGAPGGVPGL